MERPEEISRELEQEKSMDNEKTDKRGKKFEEKPTQAVVSHPERRVAPPAKERESAPATPETPVPFTASRVSHGRLRRQRLRFNGGAAELTEEAKLLLAKYPAAQFFGPDGRRCSAGFIPKQRGFLDLYSGAAGVARALAKRYGVWVLSFEYEHCPSEDLLEPSTQDYIMTMINAGCFYGVGAAPECCSFSRAITPAVRSRRLRLQGGGLLQALRRRLLCGEPRWLLFVVPTCLGLKWMGFDGELLPARPVPVCSCLAKENAAGNKSSFCWPT